MVPTNIGRRTKKYDFFDSSLNNTGQGFPNNYEVKIINNDSIVVDKSSGLIWQKGGSNSCFTTLPAFLLEQIRSNRYCQYSEIEKWINDLNKKSFAGYNDWRLPTLEEAMTLVEPTKKTEFLNIDPVFSEDLPYIWTSDQVNGKFYTWVVCFGSDVGCTNGNELGSIGYLRLVRSL